jgi:signal transduction histidine kinase
MSQLIDDLLSLSRVTRAALNRQRVNLSDLVREIAAELQAREPQRLGEFIVTDNLVVEGDARLLRIALENLLGNAWKYTGKRDYAVIEFGAVPASEFRRPGEGAHLSRRSSSLVYCVRDNGAGFDMNYASKLFAPFQRLHAETDFPGTGIGLATVQRIISRHGGQIWCEAARDQGAAFYFTIDSG